MLATALNSSTRSRQDQSPREASLAAALTWLALERQLTWRDVEELLELAQLDIDRAVADVDFGDWFEGRPLRTARSRAIYRLLGGAHILLPIGNVLNEAQARELGAR